jgi:hypothetical protein
MACNHRRSHTSGHHQTRNKVVDHSTPLTAQKPATRHNQQKARAVEEIVSPVFNFLFNDTYASQVEIPEDQDHAVYTADGILEPTAKGAHQGVAATENSSWDMGHDRNCNYSYGNETSYISIARPWEEQLPPEPDTRQANNGQLYLPLTVWERQTLIEEPFNNIGQVAANPSYLQQHYCPDETTE